MCVCERRERVKEERREKVRGKGMERTKEKEKRGRHGDRG